MDENLLASRTNCNYEQLCLEGEYVLDSVQGQAIVHPNTFHSSLKRVSYDGLAPNQQVPFTSTAYFTPSPLLCDMGHERSGVSNILEFLIPCLHELHLETLPYILATKIYLHTLLPACTARIQVVALSSPFSSF